MYISQHFEPIQYVHDLSKFFPTFQINDFKITIDFNDFLSLSKSMVQQPPIQLLQLTTRFYWNESFDFVEIYHWSMLLHC
jgi:hypothetical protein